MITDDRIFVGCVALNQVDLVEEAELHETIAALHLDTWRVVLNREIDSINLILPNARAGNDFDDGEKSETIQEWTGISHCNTWVIRNYLCSHHKQ